MVCFLRHPGQWFCNLCEVLDKFPVITCEAVEGAYIAKTVRCRPIANGCELVGLWLDPISRDHVAQEVNWTTE